MVSAGPKVSQYSDVSQPAPYPIKDLEWEVSRARSENKKRQRLREQIDISTNEKIKINDDEVVLKNEFFTITKKTLKKLRPAYRFIEVQPEVARITDILKEKTRKGEAITTPMGFLHAHLKKRNEQEAKKILKERRALERERKENRPKVRPRDKYLAETIRRRGENFLRMHQGLAALTGKPVDCSEVIASLAHNLGMFRPNADGEAKFLKDIIQGRISEADWPEEDRKLWAEGELKEWAKRELKKIPRFSRYKAGKPKWTKREMGKLVRKAMKTPGKYPYIDKVAKRLGMSKPEVLSMVDEAKRLGLKTDIGKDKSGREFLKRD
jgi:hypothetical protein